MKKRRIRGFEIKNKPLSPAEIKVQLEYLKGLRDEQEESVDGTLVPIDTALGIEELLKSSESKKHNKKDNKEN